MIVEVRADASPAHVTARVRIGEEGRLGICGVLHMRPEEWEALFTLLEGGRRRGRPDAPELRVVVTESS